MWQQVAEPEWLPVFVRSVSCVKGCGMVVDAKRGIVVVSGADYRLHVYSLTDGSLLRSLGRKGDGKGEFHWEHGGLCLTSRGTVLVAERYNRRVQEVNLDDGSWVRFLGGASGELLPGFVDCNETIVAVSETERHRVTLLSWVDGRELARFGGVGDGADNGQLSGPTGLRLLPGSNDVVVADHGNDRLCVFSWALGSVWSLPAGQKPWDVVSTSGGRCFVVVDENNTVTRVSVMTGEVVPFGSTGNGEGQFSHPVALAMVPVGERGHESLELVVVLEMDNSRFQVFRE